MIILRLVKSGFVDATKKWKWLLAVYIGLAVIGLFFFIFKKDISFFIFAIILIAFMSGLILYIMDYPVRNTRKNFNTIFGQIQLIDRDELPPYFLYDRIISEYAKMAAFYTTIPISTWQKKQEELETIINAKIVDIKPNDKNKQITEVYFQTKHLPTMTPWDDRYIVPHNELSIGISYLGMVKLNLEKHPHTFIAGETGSGKSVIMKSLIHQSIMKEYDIVLIDFKRGVSFSNFSNAIDVCYEHTDALKVLKGLVVETHKRLDLFRENRVDNLKDYNKMSGLYLKRKIVFIDELAELLKIRDKEISNLLYDCVETLTRISRSAGIHLILGIQRPDSTVVNGQIKNNVSFRICGRFVDKEPSRIMLGTDIASRLPTIKGRFIVRGDTVTEVQAFYFEDSAIYQVKEEPEPRQGTQAVADDIKESIKDKEEGTPIQQPAKTNTNNSTNLNDFNFDFTDIQK